MNLLSFVKNSYEEKYNEHIKSIFEEWRKIENRIIKPLKYLYENINIIDLDKLVKLMFLFHDCGKLTPIYQQYLRRKKESGSKLFYRHEFVSTIACFHSLKNMFTKEHIEKERAIKEVCGAIIFHHSFWAYKILDLSHIDDVISHLGGIFKKEIVLCEGAPKELKMLGKELIGIDLNIAQSFSLEDAEEYLKSIYIYLGQQGVYGQRAMLRSTALLQILCVCDNRAAFKRGKETTHSPYFKEILSGGLLGG